MNPKQAFYPTCAALLLALSIFTSYQARANVLMGPITNASNGHLYYLLAPTNWTIAQKEAMSLGGKSGHDPRLQ